MIVFVVPIKESLHKQTPSSLRSRSDSGTPRRIRCYITHSSDSPGPSPGSDTSYYTGAAEVPMKTQEDKMTELTFHVRTFSEALSSLQSTFTEWEGKDVYYKGLV